MLDTTSLIDYEDKKFYLFEQSNFDITLGGEHVTMPTPTGKCSTSSRQVFLPLWTYHSFSLTNQPPTSLLTVILGVSLP
jgi:hypothetical protein